MKRRGPQGSRSAQNDAGDFVVAGVTCWIELDQLLALGDPDGLSFAGNGQSLLAVDLDLIGDDGIGLRNGPWSQELLGARAARSTLAVVVPANVSGHGVSKCSDAIQLVGR